jgi:hypothetical protein
MFGLIEAGQCLGDGFFEFLQIVSGGNFGGIGEQFLKGRPIVLDSCAAFCSARRL